MKAISNNFVTGVIFSVFRFLFQILTFLMPQNLKYWILLMFRMLFHAIKSILEIQVTNILQDFKF